MLKDPYRPLPDNVAPSEDDRIGRGAEAYAGQSERRLTLRLFNYWRHIRGEFEFPPLRAVDPAIIPGIWPYVFVLDVAEGCFRFVGSDIARLSGVSPNSAAAADLKDNTLLAKATSNLEQMLRRRCPITSEGRFYDPRGAAILYRSVMLPLSDDGEAIDRVLGAGNCKGKDG